MTYLQPRLKKKNWNVICARSVSKNEELKSNSYAASVEKEELKHDLYTSNENYSVVQMTNRFGKWRTGSLLVNRLFSVF